MHGICQGCTQCTSQPCVQHRIICTMPLRVAIKHLHWDRRWQHPCPASWISGQGERYKNATTLAIRPSDIRVRGTLARLVRQAQSFLEELRVKGLGTNNIRAKARPSLSYTCHQQGKGAAYPFAGLALSSLFCLTTWTTDTAWTHAHTCTHAHTHTSTRD